MNTTPRLAAILAADVVGYSRLMGVDEVATLQAHRREVVDPAIAALKSASSPFAGTLFRCVGDLVLQVAGPVIAAKLA